MQQVIFVGSVEQQMPGYCILGEPVLTLKNNGECINYESFAFIWLDKRISINRG